MMTHKLQEFPRFFFDFFLQISEATNRSKSRDPLKFPLKKS